VTSEPVGLVAGQAVRADAAWTAAILIKYDTDGRQAVLLIQINALDDGRVHGLQVPLDLDRILEVRAPRTVRNSNARA
jgi:hypothetical protein